MAYMGQAGLDSLEVLEANVLFVNGDFFIYLETKTSKLFLKFSH